MFRAREGLGERLLHLLIQARSTEGWSQRGHCRLQLLYLIQRAPTTCQILWVFVSNDLDKGEEDACDVFHIPALPS